MFLYFSSESHIHALRNVIQLCGLPSNKTVATTLEATELSYLSHGVHTRALSLSLSRALSLSHARTLSHTRAHSLSHTQAHTPVHMRGFR